MKPTLGRILHVDMSATDTPTWCAAIVILCSEDGAFRVQVFAPWDDAVPRRDVRNLTPESEGKTWRWPPREGS